MSNYNGMFLGNGGLKGYYQAHLMSHILNKTNSPQFLIGNCIGAINAFLYSCLGPIGLCDEWEKYVKKKRGSLITKGLFSKKVSLPKLHDKMTKILKDNPFKVPFYVSTINPVNGFVEFVPNHKPNIIDIIISGAINNGIDDNDCVAYLWELMKYHTEKKRLYLLFNEKPKKIKTDFYGQTEIFNYFPITPLNAILEFHKGKFAAAKLLAEKTIPRGV